MRLPRPLILAAVLVAAAPSLADASVVRGSAFSPDRRDLYVVAQDGEEDGSLSHYSVGPDGALTYVGCYGLVAGCGPSGFSEFDWPRGVAVSADGGDVYVLNPGLAQYRRAADGRLTYVGKATGGRMAQPNGFALSPDGRNAYVVDGAENVFRESRVLHYRRDPASGTHTYAGCVGADFRPGRAECFALPAGVSSTAGANAVTVSADSRHVYTTGFTSSSNAFEGVTAVTHFRAGADGALAFADCIGNAPSGCATGVPAAADTRASRMLGLAFEPGGLSVPMWSTRAETVARFTTGAQGELAFAGCSGFSAAPLCRMDGAVTAPAVIELLAPDDPQPFGAGLKARIKTQGGRFAVRWEYGPTTAYGFHRDGASTYETGGWTMAEANVGDIAPGRTYHYRLVVNTPAGVVYSPDATFTTAPWGPVVDPPIVEQHAALGNAGTGVAFTATVDGSGFETRYWFDYGETESYGRTTPVRTVADADGRTLSVRELVTGLKPGTRYFFRIVAENAAGRAVGGGSEVTMYTGPRVPDPDATPVPEPEPSATPDPTSTPSPVREPAAAAFPPSPVPVPALAPETARIAPAAPRVSVRGRRITVTVAQRTRITIHRRSGKRWVPVVRTSTIRTYRRTLKPGVYRVVAGTTARRVRVR